MAMTENPGGQLPLHVDPQRVIHIIKNRLTEEMTKSSLLEAALQESQQREQGVAQALARAEHRVRELEEAADQLAPPPLLTDPPQDTPPPAFARKEKRPTARRPKPPATGEVVSDAGS